MLIKEVPVNGGQILWSLESKPDYCFIIKSGKFHVNTPITHSKNNNVSKQGTLIGDFPFLLGGKDC